MSGSSYGKLFSFTTWGESHGKAIGVCIDGCPAGIPLCEEDIQSYLDRRKPGQSRYTTKRAEDDAVEILSGVFEGRTTGTPISLVVFNKDQRSRDYSEIASYYRPGHADYCFDAKYGFRDYRGGGRSSGRETIGRVAAGAVAMKILHALGIEVFAYAEEIGGIRCETVDPSLRDTNPFYMPDANAAAAVQALAEKRMSECDSIGGIISCVVKHMPVGIGEPVFEKLDANLSRALFSIGAVKGVEIGDGFAAARSTGSENNDEFLPAEHTGEPLKKASNHAGGILGGMSDGSDIRIRAAVKPTPSIGKEQQTVTRDGDPISISIRGRHDPIIVPRAVVVVEAMTAVTLVDMLFAGMTARMDRICSFFGRSPEE
ncbi:chorismate synthase [Fusibacillus kribbianus]|uniref:Chorismate synthase n=1 Tax=Fusibacillus kribbianus TaxID=3044208 RepID=A0AAP4BE94_9FIRM|nr:chorismate synthase [Ruminococcus sp. YH-rum2234]MDI9242899.1 chorismate synthase [Ruminococcus sp. YH-rum2234]